MPRIVATDYRPRLEAAAAAVRDARGSLNLRIRQRNELVVEAHDAGGMSQREILKAAGLKSTGTITQILANSQPEEDL